MEKKNRTVNVLLYFCFAIGIFSVILFSAQENIVDIDDPGDISRVDFTEEIARINPLCAEWYPEQLLTPDDLASKAAKPADTANDGWLQYGTNRFILRLTPGKAYGLAGISNAFAQTLWVDGEILSRVGTPGENAETIVARTKYIVFCSCSLHHEIHRCKAILQKNAA